jgi:hypothetical protein
MAYSSITKPSEHFNTKLYSGNGSTNAITGVGFKPDWVWIKGRSGTYNTENHNVYDSTRGVTKLIIPNGTTVNTTDANGLTVFGTDGFSLGTRGDVNGASTEYCSWNFKANGGTTSSNTDGSITSTVQANTTSGFSIVSYTGTGSAATVGHGLNSAPTYMVIKNISSARNWANYHSAYSPSKNAEWNTTIAAESNGAAMYNSTAPTSSVFSVNTSTSTNESGDSFIAYCWHEVKGYSKISTYTGNASSDGPFIYCGFKPAFLIIKRTASTDEREIYDSARIGYNSANYHLNVTDATAEATLTERVDILSNGFKIRASSSGPLNASGAEYNFIAIAEQPLVANVSGGLPTTAR